MPVSVDIDAFVMEFYFIIFFDHHPIPQLFIYIMHLRCYLSGSFLDIVFDHYIRGGMSKAISTKNVE